MKKSLIISSMFAAVISVSFILLPHDVNAQAAPAAEKAAPAAEKAAPAAEKAAPAAEAAAPAAEAAAVKVPAEVDYSILPEPMAFAKAQYAEALRLNALAPSADRDNLIRAYVDALIDYDDFAVRSLGDKWGTLTADKQKEFQGVFKELLELTYLERFSDKAFKDNYNIEWDRVVKKRTSAVVSCFTQQKDVETEFELILHAVDKHWEVYDVLIDGASLAQTYQKKYGKKIDERGIDAIIADMKKEIERLKTKKR